MKNKFTKKIAKEIAENQFAWTLDCVIGYSDPDYNLLDKSVVFEQNFTEDLENKGITATPVRVEIINQYYDKLVLRARNTMHKLYPKVNKKS